MDLSESWTIWVEMSPLSKRQECHTESAPKRCLTTVDLSDTSCAIITRHRLKCVKSNSTSAYPWTVGDNGSATAPPTSTNTLLGIRWQLIRRKKLFQASGVFRILTIDKEAVDF